MEGDKKFKKLFLIACARGSVTDVRSAHYLRHSSLFRNISSAVSSEVPSSTLHSANNSCIINHKQRTCLQLLHVLRDSCSAVE